MRAQYEPGSSLKIFSIGAGIEQGLFDENTKYLVDDKIEIIEGSCAKNYDGLKGCYKDFLNHDPYEISIKEIIERSSKCWDNSRYKRFGYKLFRRLSL